MPLEWKKGDHITAERLNSLGGGSKHKAIFTADLAIDLEDDKNPYSLENLSLEGEVDFDTIYPEEILLRIHKIPIDSYEGEYAIPCSMIVREQKWLMFYLLTGAENGTGTCQVMLFKNGTNWEPAIEMFDS